MVEISFECLCCGRTFDESALDHDRLPAHSHMKTNGFLHWCEGAASLPASTKLTQDVCERERVMQRD